MFYIAIWLAVLIEKKRFGPRIFFQTFDIVRNPRIRAF